MKKIIFFLATSLSLIYAQNFVGTLTYTNTDTGEGMKYFTPYIPGSYEVHFNGTDIAVKYHGGIFNNVRVCVLAPKNQGLIIVDSAKIYSIVKAEELENPKKQKVEKLDETEVIMGHTCTKYKVWQDDSVYKNTYYVWIAHDMPISNPGIMNELGGEPFVKTVPFAVLKMETMVGLHYEVTQISTTSPSTDLFNTPKGYKLEKKLFRKVEEKEDKKK